MIKQKNMRLLLTFIIFILGGFYTFGDNNCCEQCCKYLKNCCNKEKGEVKNVNNVEEKKEGEGNKKEGKEKGVQGEFYLKKSEATDHKEIKKLVNTHWYDSKEKEASFILYKKIDSIVNGSLNDNNVIKVTKYKNGFNINEDFITEEDNTKKWALFEIIYKEEKGEEGKTVYLYCSDIESGQYYGIFSSCKQHISISVIACNTSNVTNMSSMFYDCSSLTELDLSNFNTETVTDMGSMFGSCEDLTKIIFGDKFNTAKVKNMSSMFSNCSSLMKLDLSKFNTDIVTDMGGMFYKCSSLTKLNLSNFNTKNVTDMNYIFISCDSLRTVTFNEILNEGIKNLLNELGFTEEGKGEGNIITLKKK